MNSFFYNIRQTYNRIRSWIYYHTTKAFFNLLKTTLSGFPWDYSYLYSLEKAKIQEMIAHHEKNHIYVGVEHDIRDMKICVKLIDAFLETDNFIGYGAYNVNLGNVGRFAENDVEKDAFLKFPDELYKKKARYLYHKIRYERDGSWWD